MVNIFIGIKEGIDGKKRICTVRNPTVEVDHLSDVRRLDRRNGQGPSVNRVFSVDPIQN